MKTIVSKATVSNNVSNISNKRDNRYIKFVRPELFANPELTSGENKAGVFVLLGTEKLANFNLLLRFANIASEVDRDVYDVYAEGISKKETTKAYKDAVKAQELLLNQGFYAIVNVSARPQNIFGSNGTKYQYGIAYDDVFTAFGVPVRNDKGYTNYQEKSLGYFLGYATKAHVAKVAEANNENVSTFIEDVKQFIIDNANSLSFIKETEAKIAEIKASGEFSQESFVDIDYKQLSAAKTQIAQDVIELAFAYPFRSYAKSGNVRAFSL